MTEKRAIERLSLTLPVNIKMENKDVDQVWTKNISSNGAFLQSLKLLETGSKIDLAIQLPSRKDQQKVGPNMMKVSGKVIRIDTDGMAVLFDNEAVIYPQTQSMVH